jgi:hypothetical protein
MRHAEPPKFPNKPILEITNHSKSMTNEKPAFSKSKNKPIFLLCVSAPLWQKSSGSNCSLSLIKVNKGKSSLIKPFFKKIFYETEN